MRDRWARRVWERKDPLGRVLWFLVLPLSWVYRLAVQVRNLLYHLRWTPSRSLPCAVVSVGNLTVGGTGKTPTTLWLAHELEKRGYKVAILSRGYKRAGRDPAVLDAGWKRSVLSEDRGGPLDAGDEPTMMARLFGQKVGVGKKRYNVGRRMLQDVEVDLFLLDDGFQHRQLKRDLDLLLLGSDWNGWLLPAGPFREPRSALRRAQLYLVTGARKEWEFLLSHRPKESIFFGTLQPKGLLSWEGDQWQERPLGLLSGSKVVTVCAVASPTSFYRMIHEWGGNIVDTVEFPDHHLYSIQDWQRISRSARSADFIITTEKDILKLARFPFAREKLLALRVEMVVEDGDALIQAIEDKIQSGQR